MPNAKPAGGARTENRSDVVYAELLRALSSLELSPGSALSENRVASEFGVSRTPVREALRRLEMEGLVEQPGHGTFVVRGLNERDIHEVCDLLELLDGYVVTRAARLLSESGRAELTSLVDTMAAAAARGDTANWNEADLRFHRLLEEAADNETISNVVRQTRARVHRFWASGVRSERLQACSEEHRELANALIDGNDEFARSLAVGHVDHMRNSLVELAGRIAPFVPRSTYS